MKKILFNPFEDYGDRKLLLAALIITLAGSLLGMFFNARFDGVLDLHFSENVGYRPFLDNALAIVCTILALFILGRILNQKTRLIDIANASMIARIPIYCLTFFNLNGFMNDITERLMKSASPQDIDAISASDLASLLAFSLLGIVFLVLFFILLWNGFRVASNARGTNHIIAFIITIVIGEAISKLFFLIL